jgi:hypothetical protein
MAQVSVENEQINHFGVHLKKTSLMVISVSDSHVLRRHDLDFDASLEGSDSSEEAPNLVDTQEVHVLKLVKFHCTNIKLDPFGRFIVLIDSQGQIKVILSKELKTVREGRVGFGPVKTRLFKDFVLCLSKDRVLSVYDVKRNKKHKTFDLKKYSAVDTQFYEFIVLDEKMRYFITLFFSILEPN